MNRRLSCLLAVVALAGCASARPALLHDGTVVKKGYYRVAAPAGWLSLKSLGKDTLTFTQMIVDAEFARCPQTELISVGRAAYRQKAAAPGHAGDQELIDMANGLLEEVHSARRGAGPRTAIESRIVAIAGLRAVEVTCETSIPGGRFCDPSHPLGLMKERYILVDGAGRGLGLSLNSGVWAQKFVVLHFESPLQTFDADAPAFERIANTLELDPPAEATEKK